MLKRTKSLLLALTMVLGLVGFATPATANANFIEGDDQAAVLFDPLKVVSIEINRVLGGPALTKEYLDYEGYRKANIKIRMAGTRKYKVLMNVGIRQKGNYTRRYEKMSLKIKFDEFVPDQHFLGLTRLTLNAMMQDPSFVHETTAYKLYRAVGVPAPRTGYAEVRVDGSLIGLYLNLESIDSDMLKRWFESSKHLYSGPPYCDLTPDQHCYLSSIGDNLQEDLLSATKLHNLHGKRWWTSFNRKANVSQVIKLMSTDIFLSNWDGYTNLQRNNHFVHFDKKGRFSIIPWGLDNTFPTDSELQLNWDGTTYKKIDDTRIQSTLLTHCLEYSPCHDQLIQEGLRVSQLAKSIDLVGYKNTVATKVTRNKYIMNDMSDATSASVSFAQNWMDSFLAIRESSIINFLKLRQ